MNTRAIGALAHSQTKNIAKSDSMKLPAPMPTKNAIDETTKQASVRTSICDLLRCFSPKTSRSVTRTHQLNALHIVYIAHCSRKLFHAVENGTSVCLSAAEASKAKISKQSLAQLRRKLTKSARRTLAAPGHAATVMNGRFCDFTDSRGRGVQRLLSAGSA